MTEDDNREILHSLIARLRQVNTEGYWEDEVFSQEALLFPGRLPDELPVQIPLPEHSRLIGSARPLPRSEIEVILETDLDPEAFLDRYRLQLEAHDWELLRWFPSRHGFVASVFPSLSGIFYHVPEGQVLAVTAFRRQAGVVLVHLELWHDDDEHSDLEYDTHVTQLAPLLPAPLGSDFIEDGGGGSRHEHGSEARIRTDMDLPTLHAYYEEQLVAKGWERTDVREDATRIESDWAFVVDDDDYESQLTVASTTVPQEYKLRLASIQKSLKDPGWPLEQSLSLLRDYDTGFRHAYLSSWARAEQGLKAELTQEDRAAIRGMLDLPADEAVRREALQAVGAERSYNLLSSALGLQYDPEEGETVETYPLYFEQHMDDVSWLLREVKVGLTVIVVTIVVWTQWPAEVAWPEDWRERPDPVDGVGLGVGHVTDDLGTLYRPGGGRGELFGPIRVHVADRNMLTVGQIWHWNAVPGPPRNARALTLRLGTELSVLQPQKTPPPWPSRRIRFPHPEFTFSLGDRKEVLEDLGVPLPRTRGPRVQL